MTPKYILKKAANGLFTFNLFAENSEIILTSETYPAKENALYGIEAVRLFSQNDVMYEKRTADNSLPYFVLKTPNNKIIGTSEFFSSAMERDNGIKIVKENAPRAVAVDFTR